MVSISLYRGNLHRVPDLPRRWLMPARKISLKEFKSLLNRRTKALSRLRSPAATTAVATTSHHNPNPNPNPNIKKEVVVEEEPKEKNREEERTTPNSITKEVVKDHDDVSNSDRRQQVDVAVCNGDEKLKDDRNDAEVPCKADGEVDEKDKRKNEVEEKLEVLNQKKHNLVQVLKQILNVEEELKRRNNVQGTATSVPPPIQVEVTNDSGSMSRQATPRMSSEANVGGDLMEGGEPEDVLNQNHHNNTNNNSNHHSRHLKRMSSTSPSSESPLRKASFNVLPHPSRPSIGTTSSPSRFAPTGHQGPPANLPAVSASGTNYIASSPSPAASGGTSAFRDARQPSPWN
ncbi:uncharacterized protein LOC126673605 [Mercurialis annua]|uniref:uncharacterized protein LOC126673605 n=1 Tax=Mercurialis annua TaxID=3986 RepID=UPI002160EAC0|nr:uncharacterized protein LOC126673605 [Mercurialis annua]